MTTPGGSGAAKPRIAFIGLGNMGLGILSDPEVGSDPNHVLLYGVSFARALQQGLEFVADINGRFNTRESENDNGLDSRSNMRVGMVTKQPSAYSAVSMSVPARMRNGAPRLTMSNADGAGGSVSRGYGGAPSR